MNQNSVPWAKEEHFDEDGQVLFVPDFDGEMTLVSLPDAATLARRNAEPTGQLYPIRE